MKTSAVKQTPSAWRDVQRDWEGWSLWERRIVSVLGISSTVSGVFWLAMSANLIH